ncbi:hypothetical protein BASA81_015446 [Batrachochytrium salamandrivorans]|nr:hypothetical protein BASA81_015446 [Batrachochytrium salamandrivorans]
MLATANVYLIGSGWVAQFEQKPAITGLYIPPRPVGKLVSYTVLLTLLVTGALGQMLESSIQAGDLRILVVFLLLPVVTIFTAVLLNGGGGRDSIGRRK